MSHTPFDQEFKKLRLASGMTQDAAAKRFGVSVRMIAYWESNQHLPDETEQESILKTLREPATPLQAKPAKPIPGPANLQQKPAIADQPATTEPAKPAIMLPEPAKRDLSRTGPTDTPRAIALAAEWAKRSNIYPPTPLPYGLSPAELLEAHSRGEPGITISQRRHALQWIEILGAKD